jgi:RecB family exonuclease
MVLAYAETLDPDDEPRGVERTVATRTARLAVSGRVDRIDERGGERVVVDYKTGRRPPTLDDVRGSLALALYALAVRQTLRTDCHRVELHHLPTGEVVGWDHSGESLARHLRRAESIGEEAAAADERFRAGLPADQLDEVFPPRPSALCGWCDYARHCEQGRAVSEVKQSWAALDAALPVEVWQE